MPAGQGTILSPLSPQSRLPPRFSGLRKTGCSGQIRRTAQKTIGRGRCQASDSLGPGVLDPTSYTHVGVFPVRGPCKSLAFNGKPERNKTLLGIPENQQHPPEVSLRETEKKTNSHFVWGGDPLKKDTPIRIAEGRKRFFFRGASLSQALEKQARGQVGRQRL